MTNTEIIRAWKDTEYRAGLSESALSCLPENPAGQLKLSDNDVRVNPFCPSLPIDSCVRPPQQCP